MESHLEVTSLTLYPVKSCGGIALRSAKITPTGLATPNGLLRDRTWMVTKDTGKFTTQRQDPKLALVRVSAHPPALLSDPSFTDTSSAALVLNAPGMPDLRVPLAPPAGQQEVPAEVWEWKGRAVDEGAAAAEWFSTYLGKPARLLRYAGAAGAAAPVASDPLRRGVDPEWAPPGQETAFCDGFPFLLATEASLAALNAALEAAVPMDRFRPNIVVAGGTAWDEDGWERVRFGGAGRSVEMLAVKPCDRCKIPTIDQATGVADPGDEPRHTLGVLRSGNALGWTDPPSFKLSVFFAINLVATTGGGELQVGDSVEVVGRRLGPPRKVAAAS